MPDDKDRGLYGKYYVERIDVSPKHKDCAYFVLDIDHDPLAAVALAAYADAAEEAEYEELAEDLRNIL